MKITIALYFTLIISIFVSIDSSKNQRRIRTSSKTKDCPCDQFLTEKFAIQEKIRALSENIDEGRGARMSLKKNAQKTKDAEISQWKIEKQSLIEESNGKQTAYEVCMEKPLNKAACFEHHGISDMKWK